MQWRFAYFSSDVDSIFERIKVQSNVLKLKHVGVWLIYCPYAPFWGQNCHLSLIESYYGCRTNTLLTGKHTQLLHTILTLI